MTPHVTPTYTLSVTPPDCMCAAVAAATAEAPTWSVQDVTKWLTNLGLESYVPQFSEHAISGDVWLLTCVEEPRAERGFIGVGTGEVLLELTAEDLDFMKVSILGHRKVPRAASTTPPSCAAPPHHVTLTSSCFLHTHTHSTSTTTTTTPAGIITLR